MALVDFDGRRLTLTNWARARQRLAELPLKVAVVASSRGHFFVDALVGGTPMRLAVDTGAARSFVYLPRTASIPDGGRLARVRVGPLAREVGFELVEPLRDSAMDGVLGMDVLRDCVLALDQARLELACKGEPVPAGSSGATVDVHDWPWPRRRLVADDGLVPPAPRTRAPL